MLYCGDESLEMVLDDEAQGVVNGQQMHVVLDDESLELVLDGGAQGVVNGLQMRVVWDDDLRRVEKEKDDVHLDDVADVHLDDDQILEELVKDDAKDVV